MRTARSRALGECIGYLALVALDPDDNRSLRVGRWRPTRDVRVGLDSRGGQRANAITRLEWHGIDDDGGHLTVPTLDEAVR